MAHFNIYRVGEAFCVAKLAAGDFVRLINSCDAEMIFNGLIKEIQPKIKINQTDLVWLRA